jgi:membrane protein implicated in regulation of membrane protease activity
MSYLIWILAGIAMLIAEIFVSGYFLLGFGFSAILAGILFPRQFSGWMWEILAFAAAGTLFYAVFRWAARRQVIEVETGPDVHKLVGRVGLVMERIISWRAGVVEIDGRVWEAISETREPLHRLGKVVVKTVRKHRLVVQGTDETDPPRNSSR